MSAIESSTQAARKTQTQLATELREAQAKVALLEARLAESQAQQAALEALYRDLAPSRDEIAISEIEQVLLVASQQLQLAGNVSSALTALQLADTKLQRLDRPQFVPLRRALSRDMDRLKAVPYVDIVGMSLKLDQAIAAVDTLPLAMDERVPPRRRTRRRAPADDSQWRRLLREIWGDVKQLIRIEVADRPAAPLVPVRAAVFSAREPEAASAHRADRAPRAKRCELRCRSRGRRGVDQAILRHAGEIRADAAGERSGNSPQRRCPAKTPDLTPQPRSLARAASRPGSRAGTGSGGRARGAIALMRVLFWFLLLAGAAVAVALAARLTTGYALFVAPPYRVELSLNLLLLVVLGGFIAGYVLLRIVRRALDAAGGRAALPAASASGARPREARCGARRAARRPLRPRAAIRRRGPRDTAIVGTLRAPRRARGHRDARVRRGRGAACLAPMRRCRASRCRD